MGAIPGAVIGFFIATLITHRYSYAGGARWEKRGIRGFKGFLIQILFAGIGALIGAGSF